MRFLKLTSDKNPEDYILFNGGYFDEYGEKIKTLKETNGTNPYKDSKGIERKVFENFNGFLCTSFQTLGIKRRLEFLSVKNRQFVVDNKPEFKKYAFTVEIFSKYEDFEIEYKKLLTFFDKNKNDYLRLYYRPYDNAEMKYCLCSIDNLSKFEKMKPITFEVIQNSLWFGEEKIASTSLADETNDNIFAFIDYDETGYYSAGYLPDEELNNYNIAFFSGSFSECIIVNNSYNKIPLNIKIYGHCEKPVLFLYKIGEDEPFKVVKIDATIRDGYFVEINAKINENGVWYVNSKTKEKFDYEKHIDNNNGSPYIYIDNGEYLLRIVDNANNVCLANITFREEYNE